MSKEKNKRRIRQATAAAAAMLLAAAFTFPAGTDMSGLSFGNTIVSLAETTADSLEYSDNGDGTVTITGYYGPVVGCVVIPSTIDGNTVTSIGDGAFSGCISFTSITIPKSVTYIGKKAFYCCESLTSITIPDSVTSIGDYAFYSCGSIESVTFVENSKLETIGSGVFSQCKSLASITIPNRVTSIGDGAFSGCKSLTSITIPNSVTSIGDYAFNGSSLTCIAIPDRVTSIGDGAFQCCSSLENVTFGENSQLTSIGRLAFYSCESLKSITIPADVTSIGQSAFSSCTSFTSIFLPEGVAVSSAKIPETATQVKYTVSDEKVTITEITLGTDQTSFTIPETIDGKTVTAVFIEDRTTGVVIPDTAAQIKYTVDGDNVTVTDIAMGSQTSLTIPDTIGGKTVTAVFIEDGTTGVVIPDTATQIKYTVDEDEKVTITEIALGTGQTSVVIPDTIDGKNVAYINMGALSSCTGLTNLFIPKTLTISADGIPETAITVRYSVSDNEITISGIFSSKVNASVVIPEAIGGKNVTSIGEMAFAFCSNLESITIPKNVASIGDAAFNNCSSLTSIEVDEGNAYFCSADGILFNKEKTSLLAYPTNKSGVSYTIPDGVTSIAACGFMSSKNLESITIPTGVDTIGMMAFTNCSSLTSIEVDEDNAAFCSIDGVLFNKAKTSLLTYPANKSGVSYDIPNGVNSIEMGAFYLCKNIESIAVPNSVKSIGAAAFMECTSLTSIFFTDNTAIGEEAISKSTTQVKYTVADNKVTITEIALGTDLTSVDIPAAIGGYPVAAVAEDCRQYVGKHTHVVGEGTVNEVSCTKDGVTVSYKCSVSGEDITYEYAFDEVTDAVVDILKAQDMQLVIDFVNYSTDTDGSDTIILTAAQLKAIEYVLEYDLGIAS